jgi:hypothetical protein
LAAGKSVVALNGKRLQKKGAIQGQTSDGSRIGERSVAVVVNLKPGHVDQVQSGVVIPRSKEWWPGKKSVVVGEHAKKFVVIHGEVGIVCSRL